MTYVGALVFPEVMRGKIEASITRKRLIPRTRSSSSTTAIGSLPILQVPTGWKMVVPSSPAALANASRFVMDAPGRCSSGWYFASARAQGADERVQAHAGVGIVVVDRGQPRRRVGGDAELLPQLPRQALL